MTNLAVNIECSVPIGVKHFEYLDSLPCQWACDERGQHCVVYKLGKEAKAAGATDRPHARDACVCVCVVGTNDNNDHRDSLSSRGSGAGPSGRVEWRRCNHTRGRTARRPTDRPHTHATRVRVSINDSRASSHVRQRPEDPYDAVSSSRWTITLHYITLYYIT